MTNIFLLGASGSIGMQTIDVLRENRDQYCLKSISVGHNIDAAIKIIDEFDVEYVSVIEEEDAKRLQKLYPNLKIGYGDASLVEAATYAPSMKGKLVVAVVGYSGLVPTIEAIKIGRDILLANKETLVCAGEIIKSLVNEYQVNLLPIDSEHSAIFQALQAGKHQEVKRVIITASGGSFRNLTREELKNVTLEEALNHPSWSMGSKITIDSATMVNKGLEVIEAHYLFDLDYDRISTILHYESIVHSMVEYIDNSVIAQMAVSDMRLPIQYALTYPNRNVYQLSQPLDLTAIHTLHFEKMDLERFPMLDLAYKVGKAGGIMPAVYNVSNEVANYLFRIGKISFLEIEEIIKKAVNNTSNIINPSLEEILMTIENVKKEILERYEV